MLKRFHVGMCVLVGLLAGLLGISAAAAGKLDAQADVRILGGLILITAGLIYDEVCARRSRLKTLSRAKESGPEKL